MTSVQRFARVFGIIYLVVAVAGFIPRLVMPGMDMPPMAVSAQYGLLLGMFPINVLHNLVHLLIAVWGLAAAASFSRSRVYARSVAVIYGVLTLAGFVPGLNTMFGLTPLFGNDIWLHALSAIVAGYFGWSVAGRRERTTA